MVGIIILVLFVGLVLAIAVTAGRKSKHAEEDVVRFTEQAQGNVTVEGPRLPPPLAPIKLVDPACPYCGSVQDPPPERKRKCADCGEVIHTRADYEARKRYLLTADQAEQARRDQREAQWKDLSRAVEAAMRAGNMSMLATLYRQQSSILHDEGRPQSALRILAEAFRCDLVAKRNSGITAVQVMTARDGNVCDYCRELEGKMFTVADALERMPLPGPGCDNAYGHCRCVYTAVIT